LRQKKIRLLLIKVLQQVSKKIKFAYFPFALQSKGAKQA